MTKYSDMSDETLVELCLLGDSGAFEELVLRHEKAVMGTAEKVTGSRFTAEDASQDAFVSAWMRLDSLRDRSKFRPWVCAIAKNCAMALVTRYRSVVPDISLHLVENEEMADNPDPELSALISSESDEELHALVDALGEKRRETIRLHYFEGYSVAEIADLLSVPVGTVKWRLAEGRKQLRKGYGIVEKEYNENETLVSRVMRQVEELKLWQFKRDKTGFEEDYKNVLAAVEALDESKEKQHMLADVWLRGAWWIPGKANDEGFASIKAAAVAGHNDDVMQSVVCREHDKLNGEEKLQSYGERAAAAQIDKMVSLKIQGDAVMVMDGRWDEKLHHYMSEAANILEALANGEQPDGYRMDDMGTLGEIFTEHRMDPEAYIGCAEHLRDVEAVVLKHSIEKIKDVGEKINKVTRGESREARKDKDKEKSRGLEKE